MSGDRPTRVYHHHLAKCGGTTLNGWLDQQTDDHRVWNSDWMVQGSDGCADGRDVSSVADLARIMRQRAVAAFHWSDVIHDQHGLSCYAPPGTFRFTVLREPVRRLISQVADLRRLSDSDTSRFDPQFHACVIDARQMRLAPFLERHGRGVARHLLDNYLVRAIAATRLGPVQPAGDDAADLVVIARIALEQDYDLVGITEQAGRLRQVLCRRLGWAPAPDVPRLNASDSSSLVRDEAAEAADILAALTVHDAALYTCAQARFAAEDAAFDTHAFEAGPASHRLGQLRGHWSQGRTAYSVRGPLIGNGWHGRDGAGMPECAVWTGPERIATLYIPVPPGQDITVFLWVRGYAAGDQRAALRLHIDGRRVDHRFETEVGYDDVVAADTAATRDFIRLQIDVGDPRISGAPGEPEYDPRPRGLAFDRYGWAVR